MATNSKDFSRSSKSNSLDTTNAYPQSPAEQYVASQVQHPSTANANSTNDILTPESRRLVTIEQRLNQWRQNQSKEICRKEKYRYNYSASNSLGQSESREATSDRKEKR